MNQQDQEYIEQSGGGFRQKLLVILIVILALGLAIGIPTGLYFLGSDDASALEKLRDVTIVFIGVVWIIIVLLLGIMAAVMVWVAFQIKNRVLPLLEDILANVRTTSGEVTETARRARGTAEFVSDKVAQPVISTLSTIARLRTTAKMFVVDEKRRSQGKGKGS
ncbi:MAG: hypothetical protein ACOC9Y_09045 [Chloroflexota bacterium]